MLENFCTPIRYDKRSLITTTQPGTRKDQGHIRSQDHLTNFRPSFSHELPMSSFDPMRFRTAKGQAAHLVRTYT